MDSNAQKCLDKLCDELLGKDWYIVSPITTYQVNEVIVEEIIHRYKKKSFFKGEYVKIGVSRRTWLGVCELIVVGKIIWHIITLMLR